MRRVTGTCRATFGRLVQKCTVTKGHSESIQPSKLDSLWICNVVFISILLRDNTSVPHQHFLCNSETSQACCIG